MTIQRTLRYFAEDYLYLRPFPGVDNLLYNRVIIFRKMRKAAVLAVLDFFRAADFEIAAAFIAQRIQRAVAEQAIEFSGVGFAVARQVLAFAVVKESVIVFHN